MRNKDNKKSEQLSLNLDENQVIEVDYDKNIVVEDLKAQAEDNKELLVQDTFNIKTIEEMSSEDSEIEVIE